MLTRRGLGFLAGGVALAVGGRLLGAVELYVLATGAAALSAFGLAAVRWRAPAPHVARSVSPARLHVGADARVELTVTNRARQSSPVAVVADQVERTAGSGPPPPGPGRYQLAPLGPGEADRLSYRLRGGRGVYRIGPLHLVLTDPFGLASRVVPATGTTEVTIFPAIETLAPPPGLTAAPRGGTLRTAAVGGGDEFYGLRAYQVGDDLRRVHWPSTARQDHLMIRQPERPKQGRATLVLDVSSPARGLNPAGFEAAVSAVASLAVACWHDDAQVRLLTTAGFDSGFGAGPGHLDRLFEHLAVVEPTRAPAPHQGARLRRQSGGSLVLVGAVGDGGAAPAGLDALAALGSRFAWAALVLVGSPAAGTDAGASGPVQVIHAPLGVPFGPTWGRAVAAAGQEVSR